MNKRLPGLILLLLFPVFGFMGMVLILTSNQNDKLAENPTRAFPTPAPLRTTPVPTVYIVPILDAIAPPITLTTLEGEAFTVADYQGKTVIVNFWATWCTPCVREMPALQQFSLDHPDVVILAVTDPTDGQSLELIEAFLDEYQLDSLLIGLDQNSLMKGTYQAMQLPTTFVIAPDGIVRFRQIGEVTLEDLNFYLDQLQAS